MFKKLVTACVTLLSISAGLHAQQPCATDKKYREMVEKYPGILTLEKEFDDQMEVKLHHVLPAAGARTTISVSDTTIFDIPIVIHVVHDYGTEDLPDDLLYTAAQYWASIYMAQNADTSTVIAPFKQYVGDARIRLHLATKDPNGNPTKGITRHMSYLTMNADDGAKFDPWDDTKYVNIWFINTFGASATGAAAYAYLPGTAAYMPNYDGVICLADYANYAKTVPHEIGHVLNLWHPWGSTNNPDVACGDDHVDDTPPTKGHNPVGCVPSALYDTDCASGYMVTYHSASGGDSIVNYPDTVNAQNIMDYTYCQAMFTKGQVFRMRTALTGSTAGRNNLITASNLAATGALAPMPDLAPIADYIVDRAGTSGYVTDTRSYFLSFNNAASFEFRNASWNDTISSVQWSFSNGASTPTSMSMGTIENTFSVPGWVTVTEIATSNAGSDTLVNTHAVYAADTTAISPFGYVQGFDPATSANWPMFNYYNNNFKWEYYTGASADGDGKCVRYRSFDTTDKSVGSPIGDHDDFFTPAFNLTGITGNAFFNFKTSASKIFGSGTYDSLEIDVSTNGGIRWTRIGGVSGPALVNNPSSNYEYAPSATSAWAAHSINIPAVYRGGNTYFRFRYWPGDVGNNLYLDNFNIFPFATEVLEPTAEAGTFNLYPNPSTNGTNVLFKTGATGNVTLMVKDVTGRTIYENTATYTSDALSETVIGRNITQAAGIYFVTVVIEGTTNTQKLVVY